jgi:lipopolysaccharide export system protein LptA
MRRARWLILAAITIIVVAVGFTYYARLARMQRDAPPVPTPLKPGIDATAEGWSYRKTDDNRRGPNGEPCPIIEVTAQNFEQIQEPSSFQLEVVALKLFRDCGVKFDEVKSAKATFDMLSGDLYSEGDVVITMGFGAGGENSRLVKIVTSGVHFDTKTGKAYTDRAAQFEFDRGDGKSVGAEYDPISHQLRMKSQAEVNWRGAGPESPPMKVETDNLVYFEQHGVVTLEPWGRMTRAGLVVEGAKTFVTLEESVIRKVEADNARGVQNDAGRKVEYGAEHIIMEFSESGQITRVVGDRNARVSSVADTGQTDVRSDRLELSLKAAGDESVLEKAVASGSAVVESRPAVKAGTTAGETRVLKSEIVELQMREGGREIENVETKAPGTLEFLPNRPGQPKRFLEGDHFWIAYGADNRIQSFRATKASTRTDHAPRNGKPVPPVITSSQELKAEFDPKTNDMSRLEQRGDFRYQEAERKAESVEAFLDQKTALITLVGAARVWDPTGNASADRIILNQKSGDFTGEGNVTSTRLPDKKGSSSAMLSNSEAIQAKADRMTATDSRRQVRYEGHALAWQGGNRIEADCIEIDRANGVMRAIGSVVSQFVDKPKRDKDGKPVSNQATVYTIVKAPQLVYTEKNRLAHYLKGTVLRRPGMDVKAREIRAFLNEAGAESALNHAIADGDVVMVQARSGRTRTGSSEHAEYYAAEEKIVMTGGRPQFVDSLKGTTKGQELIYYSKTDRLLVNGAENKRAESVIIRK